jgi:hypothetical protein
LYRSGGDGRELIPFAVNPEVPDYHRFPMFRDAKGMECTIGPGDLLVVPGGWIHWVKSLDPTLSLTHNYMGRGNFRPALKGQLRWSFDYLLERLWRQTQTQD